MIGKDLLPNVYIDNIKIYEKRIVYSIFVLDSNENPTWSSKKNLRDKLQIKILHHSGPPDTFDKNIDGLSFRKDEPDVDSYFLFDFNSQAPSGTIFQNHKVFRKTIVKKMDTSSIKNLTIYANLFMKGVEGPLTSEALIVGREMVNNSTVFVNSNGSQYGGPVHQHNGVYMEGSTHTAAPHAKLRRISVPNLKLKDYRRHNYHLKQLVKDQPVPIFSNLIVSFDEHTKHNYMFFVNIKELLLTKTLYGRLLQNIDDHMLSDIMKNFKIRYLNISRIKVSSCFRDVVGGKRIKSPTKTIHIENVLRATEDEQNKFLKNISGEDINFISQNFSKDVYGFYFDDILDDKYYGNYQYKVEFSFYDPVIKHLNNSVDTLKDIISKSNKYLELLSSSQNYDYYMEKPKSRFEGLMPFRDDLDSFMADSLNKIKRFIFNMTDQQAYQDLVSMYKLINKKTCTIESVNYFISEAKETLATYLRVFDFIDYPIKRGHSSAGKLKKMFNANRITHEHVFNKIVSPQETKYHFDYNPKTMMQVKDVRSRFRSIAPKSFGTRGDKINLKSNLKNTKLSTTLSRGLQSKSNKQNNSVHVNRVLNLNIDSDLESFINASKYLGDETNFQNFDAKEKCEVKTVAKMTEKLSLLMETEEYDLDILMQAQPGVAIKVLNGFKIDKHGKVLVNQLLWKSYDQNNTDLNNTVVLKQDAVMPREGDLRLDFSHSNEYLLINNSPELQIAAAEVGAGAIKQIASRANVYDFSLSSSKIILLVTPTLFQDVFSEGPVQVFSDLPTSLLGQPATDVALDEVELEYTEQGEPTTTTVRAQGNIGSMSGGGYSGGGGY
jgi:hypothetical protein